MTPPTQTIASDESMTSLFIYIIFAISFFMFALGFAVGVNW